MPHSRLQKPLSGCVAAVLGHHRLCNHLPIQPHDSRSDSFPRHYTAWRMSWGCHPNPAPVPPSREPQMCWVRGPGQLPPGPVCECAGGRGMEPGSCAYLSKQGSPEEQLPKHLPTSISCKDLQNKGTKIPCSTSAGTPQDPPPPSSLRFSIHPQRRAAARHSWQEVFWGHCSGF